METDADRIPLTEDNVKKYLDQAITYWRQSASVSRDDDLRMAQHYIDAYQSVRASLFGELLPPEEPEEHEHTWALVVGRATQGVISDWYRCGCGVWKREMVGTGPNILRYRIIMDEVLDVRAIDLEATR